MSFERLAEILFENATKEASTFSEGDYIEAMNIIRDMKNKENNTQDSSSLPDWIIDSVLRVARITPLPTVAHAHNAHANAHNAHIDQRPVVRESKPSEIYGDSIVTLNLCRLKVPYLKNICKHFSIRGYSTKRKDDLIIAIRENLETVIQQNTLQQTITRINTINTNFYDRNNR